MQRIMWVIVVYSVSLLCPGVSPVEAEQGIPTAPPGGGLAGRNAETPGKGGARGARVDRLTGHVDETTTRYRAKKWQDLYATIRAVKEETDPWHLMEDFRDCPMRDLRRTLLCKLMEDERELVAIRAAQTLALTGAEEGDARRFWELHDRTASFVHKQTMLHCIGLTGDFESVGRLVEIAVSEEPDFTRRGGIVETFEDLREWGCWIGAAKRSSYLLTAKHSEPMNPKGLTVAERRLAYEGVIAQAEKLRLMPRIKSARLLIEEFLLSLDTDSADMAQFGLLRLTGHYPITYIYFYFGVTPVQQFEPEQWMRYRAAWIVWWSYSHRLWRWDDNVGHLVTREQPPADIPSFFFRQRMQENVFKGLRSLDKKRRLAVPPPRTRSTGSAAE